MTGSSLQRRNLNPTPRWRINREARRSSYYRARYYDSSTGRFANEDPLEGGGGGPNFYRYVLNNPTNLVDPFGLSPSAPAIPWPWPWKPTLPSIPWGRAIGAAGRAVTIGLTVVYELTLGAKPLGIDDARAFPKPKPCSSGRQSKCSIQSVGDGYCVYQCDDGTTVIDTSCTPYFYKDWGARH
jgi:RHS repeat-associated protein